MNWTEGYIQHTCCHCNKQRTTSKKRTVQRGSNDERAYETRHVSNVKRKIHTGK